MTVAVIVTAAGSGTRLGFGTPKALVPLAGRPILSWALDGVASASVCDLLVVTAPASLLDDVRALVPNGSLCVAGGATRQESVANAIAVLPPEVEFVLVHDAARALTPPEVFQRVVGALREGMDAVVPVLPVTDTIKEAGDPGDAARPRAAAPPPAASLSGGGTSGPEPVIGTVDRTRLRAVQTPQGFERHLLERAHGAGGDALTDDAGLVEAIGEAVWMVPGSELALKITTPFDLELAEFLAARR